METIFYLCVKFLDQLSYLFGLSYQEINVILFVFIHPLVTVIFYLLYRKYKVLYKKN